MKYAMTSPCDNCPFVRDSPLGMTLDRSRLAEFTEGESHCHKTAVLNDEDDEAGGEYRATADSQHCAGMLVYLEKRKQQSQMMRIMARLGLYDRRKLNMKANVK